MLPHEGEQVASDRGAQILLYQLQDGTPVKETALDRPAFDDGPLPRLQAVDPRGEQGLDRRRNLDLLGGLSVHRQHLFDEQRVSLGPIEDPGTSICGDGSIRGQRGHELLSFFRRERDEPDHGRSRARYPERRSTLDDFRTGDADEQNGDVFRKCGHVLDQVQHRRLRPMQVVHDEHECLLLRKCMHPTAKGPAAMLGGREVVVEARQGTQRRRQHRLIEITREQIAEEITEQDA